jgi:serine/threonine-protein kinase
MTTAPTPDGTIEMSFASDRPDADPLVQSILSAGYRVIDTLAPGPPAALYLAERVDGGGALALRVLSPDVAENAAMVRAFREHVALLGCASALFPGFAAVYESGRLGNGAHFVVQEHPAGRTLAEAIRRDGALSPGRAVRVAFEIAETLEVARKLGLVHGSLRPDNVVLVESDDTVKLAQFGFDWLLAPAASGLAETLAGSSIGTPGYMSPEQAAGRKEISPASDIYSLGAILYEMLTGVSPSVKESDCRPKPISPRELRPGITKRLERLVMRALEIPPERRPDITAFCDDLFAAIDEEKQVTTFRLEAKKLRSSLLHHMHALPRVAGEFPPAFGWAGSRARALGAAAKMWRQSLVGWSGAAFSARLGRAVGPLAVWGMLAVAVMLVIGGARLIWTPANTMRVPSAKLAVAVAPAVSRESQAPVAATGTSAGLVPLADKPAAPQPESVLPESLRTRANETDPSAAPRSIARGIESSGAVEVPSRSRIEKPRRLPRSSTRSAATKKKRTPPPDEDVKKGQSARIPGSRRAESSGEPDDPRAIIDWLLKEASGQPR